MKQQSQKQQSQAVNFSQNDLIFSFDQLDLQSVNTHEDTNFNEDEILDKDDHYYFSKDQYFSAVKRGVVELDEKAFKIYTQALLHYKRPELDLEEIFNDGTSIHSIYLNKNSLIQYVDKQFTTIQDQEVEQKVKALDSLYSTLTQQFPGFYVPKLSRSAKKTLVSGLPQEKRELLKTYLKRLADYQYLIQHPVFKSFIEKKMEIKKQISEPLSQNGTSQGTLDPNPVEVAERFRDIFAYLMEVQIRDQDYQTIDQFDLFLKNRLVELSLMRNELKLTRSKCLSEMRVEGNIYQKVTYQSLFYHLKTTAEALGIKNKQFMNIQSEPFQQKVVQQRQEIDEIMNFIDEEINELDSFKDAITSLKKYVALRNSLRTRMGKAVDQYNSYVITRNIYGRKRSSRDSDFSDTGSEISSPAPAEPRNRKNTVDKLEDEMEQLSFENASYETICQVMVANMATFDIEKFKMQRQKAYYSLLHKISRAQIEKIEDSNEYFEHIIKIMNN